MTSTRIWPSPKILVIGGGTGTSTLLKGLKNHTDNITAIISVMDDGGSTGRLRNDMDIIAMGDLRNCMVALSEEQSLISKLLNYRFSEGELAGHNFGNIFIAAMSEILSDFNSAILETSRILKIKGRVLPITLENASLIAELDDGTRIIGESKIPDLAHNSGSRISRILTEPGQLDMLEEAKKAILEADLIVLGPGSLYTSIIPNLLAKDMVKTLKMAKAKKVYISNIMDQLGETEDYSIRDHYDALIKHSCEDLIDYVLVNNGVIDPKLLDKYRQSSSHKIDFTEEDERYFKEKGVTIIREALVRVNNGVIRHDADRVSEILIKKILLGG